MDTSGLAAQPQALTADEDVELGTLEDLGLQRTPEQSERYQDLMLRRCPLAPPEEQHARVFAVAQRAFNNGDHEQVEVFLETIAPPPRRMVEALERRINQALQRHTPASARAAPVRRAVGQVACRPRERRAASRARARAPSSDDGPEPPPALAGKHDLICAACGAAFTARADARTCSGRCRKQLHDQARRRDDKLDRLADLARGLVRSGEITGDDALALVLWPTPDILAALETREAAVA